MIREVLADGLNEQRDWRYNYVNPRDIRGAEFRRGLAEIEVRFAADVDSEYPDEMTEIIPAEPVLSAILRQALQDERDT